MEDIKANVTDSTSIYFYERLVYRFNFNPTVIDEEEAKHLYYGKSFSNYKTSEISEGKFDFMNLVQNGKMKDAIVKGEELIYKEPANLELLGILSHAYSVADAENKRYALRGLQFGKMIETILKNADTKKDEKTYTLTSVADQYVIAGILKKDLSQFQRSSKMTENGVYDVWENKKTKEKLTFYIINYFDRIMNND